MVATSENVEKVQIEFNTFTGYCVEPYTKTIQHPLK